MTPSQFKKWKSQTSQHKPNYSAEHVTQGGLVAFQASHSLNANFQQNQIVHLGAEKAWKTLQKHQADSTDNPGLETPAGSEFLT